MEEFASEAYIEVEKMESLHPKPRLKWRRWRRVCIRSRID